MVRSGWRSVRVDDPAGGKCYALSQPRPKRLGRFRLGSEPGEPWSPLGLSVTQGS
jgi:hypothetical protein